MSSSEKPASRPQALPASDIDSKAPKSTTRLGDALIRLSQLVYFLQCGPNSTWTWTLRRKDGSVVALGGRSFATRAECMDAVMLTKGSQHAAVVEE